MSEPPANVSLLHHESPTKQEILRPSTSATGTSYNGDETNSNPLPYPGVSLMETVLAPYPQLNLTGRISLNSMGPRFGGAYCEIYQGQLDGQLVAVRQWRSYLYRDGKSDLSKRIATELSIWSRLDHPNILRLLGYIREENDFPSLVALWMENGTLTSYMKKYPSVDRFFMIQETAAGLAYLHGENVIHSDLKCDNILISNDGRVQLADFGLSRLLVMSQSIQSTSQLVGSVRWMAKELLAPKDEGAPPRVATKESDIWSFGMTLVEILTAKMPFPVMTNEAQVITAIIAGQLPEPPADIHRRRRLDRALWALCRRCWKLPPSQRPTMIKLLDDLYNPSFEDSVDGIIPPTPAIIDERQPLRPPNPYQYSSITRSPFNRESCTIDSTYSFVLDLSKRSTELPIKSTPRQLQLLAKPLKIHQYLQSQMRECTLSIVKPHASSSSYTWTFKLSPLRTVTAMDILDAIYKCLQEPAETSTLEIVENELSDFDPDSLARRCDLLGRECYLASLVTRTEVADGKVRVDITLSTCEKRIAILRYHGLYMSFQSNWIIFKAVFSIFAWCFLILLLISLVIYLL